MVVYVLQISNVFDEWSGDVEWEAVTPQNVGPLLSKL